MNYLPEHTFFSPISITDVPLYNYFLHKEKNPCYSNNFTYINQSCRGFGKLGYKYHRNNTLLSIGLYNNHFVIVKPLGENIVDEVIYVSNELSKFSNFPVYIKHLKTEHSNRLRYLSDNFIDMKKYPWNTISPLDDETFSQTIVSLKDIIYNLNCKSKYSKLRLRHNRFTNHFNGQVEFISYNPNKNLHQTNTAYNIVLNLAKDVSPYINMINYPRPENFNYLLYYNDFPVGFYVFGYIGRSTVGCFANICDYFHYPGLSEVALIKAFNMLHDFEVLEVNLGGSETESLFKFKNKFNPHKIFNTSHLVYYPSP